MMLGVFLLREYEVYNNLEYDSSGALSVAGPTWRSNSDIFVNGNSNCNGNYCRQLTITITVIEIIFENGN